MNESNKKISKKGIGTLRGYVIGYILSIYLTVSAYLLVTNHVSTKDILIGLIAVLALIQFFVQLLFFMHMGQDTKPRLRLLAFGLMITVVVILVAGTLWIMSNLNYRMMSSPQQMDNYVQNQQNDGI